MHLGQGARFARELQPDLFQVVSIDVCVSQCVYEITRFQPRGLRHHHEQQGIRGYVERDAEEAVRAALVELQAQPPVGHVELEKGMAGGEVHVVQVAHIPCADDDAARVRIVFNGVHGFLYLVDKATLVVRPRAPLVSIDVPKVAVRICPFVPYPYAVFLQVFHVCVSFQEPQQFIDDGLQVQFLGGEQGESVFQVEAHLVSEHADGARACAVVLFHALIQYPLQ